MIPPRSVFAAIDFSDSSRVALTFAARLATHCRAALHLLHAEDSLLVAAAASKGVDLARETRDELAIFVQSAPPAPDCAPQFHAAAGPAATVIREVAHRVQADVIVVGMRGISAAEHLMFGSTTEALLRAADISVFAVPDGWRPPQPSTRDLSGLGPVVAAVELTESSLQAAAAAARLAEILRTSVEAVHVVPGLRVLNRWQSHAGAVLEAREETATRAVGEALRAVKTSVPVSLRVESGNIAEHVADAVVESPGRHPVLVIGRRPRATGATAYRILTLARAPVLQYADEPREPHPTGAIDG